MLLICFKKLQEDINQLFLITFVVTQCVTKVIILFSEKNGVNKFLNCKDSED